MMEHGLLKQFSKEKPSTVGLAAIEGHGKGSLRYL